MDGLFSSVTELFSHETTNSRNRLKEIEDMQAEQDKAYRPDEQKRLMLEIAANIITLDKLSELVKSDRQNKATKKSKVENRPNVLKFSKKEILQMPTNYRGVFAMNVMIVHYRLRKDGVFEARFHRQGIDIEVSSKVLIKLKKRFIENCRIKKIKLKIKNARKNA